jgi:hypothetical protein
MVGVRGRTERRRVMAVVEYLCLTHSFPFHKATSSLFPAGDWRFTHRRGKCTRGVLNKRLSKEWK